MHNLPIRAFLERIYNQEDFENLYLRARVGRSQRKASLIHSNIDINNDAEGMLEEVLGYFEGWVYEEDDKCFLELMRARKTNPLDVVAFLPSDVIEQEDLEEDEVFEESAVKTLTDALVAMSMDCNHRASVAQQRYLQALEVMVDSQISAAHAQAQLAAERDDTPNWVNALSAISPAFGPLIGDIAKKVQDTQSEKMEVIEDKTEPDEPVEPKPPIEATDRKPNPLEAR